MPSLDGAQLEFALTDGERIANLHAIISRTQLATLACEPTDPDAIEWMLWRLYARIAAVPRDGDRFAALLSGPHPIQL
jgi:hypothetical protein